MKSKEEINIEKLTNLIEKGKGFIKGPTDKAIILLGYTGSGKSTLINALVGKTLLVATSPYD